MTPKTVGDWLRDKREAAGMTLEDAAFGLKQLMPENHAVASTIWRMEKPKNNQDPTRVEALAQVYGVDLDDLPPRMRAAIEERRSIHSRASVYGLVAKVNSDIPGYLKSPSARAA